MVIKSKDLKNVLQSKESETMLARASYVDSFGGRSDALLIDWDVNSRRLMRGIVKETT